MEINEKLEREKRLRTQDELDSLKSRKVAFRVFQALFAGIFALGLSLSLGDVSTASHFPISSFSIVTTIFGLIGMLLSGYFANKSQNW